MPKFELVPKHEAERKLFDTSKKGRTLSIYQFFIDSLQEGKAGKLQPSQGESVQAIRRRLRAAAKVLGKDVTIKTANQEVFFWIASKERRRRKRKSDILNSNQRNMNDSPNEFDDKT